MTVHRIHKYLVECIRASVETRTVNMAYLFSSLGQGLRHRELCTNECPHTAKEWKCQTFWNRTMIVRDLPDTLKYEGRIIRHRGLGEPVVICVTPGTLSASLYKMPNNGKSRARFPLFKNSHNLPKVPESSFPLIFRSFRIMVAASVLGFPRIGAYLLFTDIFI
jgi:hypothetical protein